MGSYVYFFFIDGIFVLFIFVFFGIIIFVCIYYFILLIVIRIFVERTIDRWIVTLMISNVRREVFFIKEGTMVETIWVIRRREVFRLFEC